MARLRICFALFIACWAVVLVRAVATTMPVHPASPEATPQPQKATTEYLGGPDRYLTAISFDKPIYKIGENVYLRGVLLNAANHKPLANGSNATAQIQIRGPKGDIVAQGNASTQDSVWGFEWLVPDGEGGGEYTAKVTYPWHGYAPSERKFEIRAYRAPRLNSQIRFLRDGYGPGEKVTATLDVKRAEGGIPEGAKVTVNATVDGTSIDGGIGKVDARGLCTVSFSLPRQIPRGEGTLALIIEDGGVVETASKTIPILLQTVDLQMYPEGGDLVAAFKNRVYVQAHQPNGKPADLTADIVTNKNGKGPIVTEFHTEHEGRGRFDFVPLKNHNYFLKVVKPTGIKTIYPLPAVKLSGAVLRADKETFAANQPITAHVGGTLKKYHVTLCKREKELAACDVKTQPSSLSEIKLTPSSDADGVLTLTVWDEYGTPLAERLVFRSPAKPLNISIKPDKASYVPGDNAKLTVKTTDSNGKPVEAVVGLTVTDDSIQQMIEKREQAPRLPVMVYLEPEVKDLADAQVYLDSKNPKAPLAVDLLLGTQGWRRFATVDVQKFELANGDAAKRVLAELDGTPKRSSLAGRDGWNSDQKRRSRLSNARIGGQLSALSSVDKYSFISAANPTSVSTRPQHQRIVSARPGEIGRVEGPRDTNLFQVEPTVVDERHYTSGRDERHQKTHPTLPEGSPIPDTDELIYRVFAHQVRADRQPTDRVDFTETLYWNRGIKTDAKTGEGTISFGLSDSVTTFDVFADGFAGNGALGAAKLGIKSVQPFYAEAKLPLEVTSGDKILLPISIINATATKLQDLHIHIDLAGPFKLLAMMNPKNDVNAGARVRELQPIEVGFGKGAQDFVLDAKANGYEDKVTRKLSIVPKGFPIEKAFGGILEPGKSVTWKISIEKNVVPESVISNAQVFPSPLASLTGALERMIQDPNGCFEQTSSTSYPLTMAQQYFLSHPDVDPKLIEQSREKLDAGYKRLVGFWCPDKGYEWFGENPGHEALTAFGLLHFNDMSQVRDVDQNMVATTRAWLMKQTDGNGGFTRKRRALHTWIEDKDCSNAYITWALLQTGGSATDLKPELVSLKTAADASKNNYVVALAANAFELSADKAEAKKLMNRLIAMQKDDGSVSGITASIVGSGGESLEVEGTALAVLAWLRDPAYAGNVEKGIKFLADSCKAGRYGSTQATVLALRAIVQYDKQRSNVKAPGKVQLIADGHPIGDAIPFDQNSKETIKLPDLSELLSAGDHVIEIKMIDGSPMPYSLAVKYNTLSPESDKECKVDITAKLAQNKVTEGASTEADVMVANKTSEAIPTPVAIVGIPGGLEPRHDQLKELVKTGTIDSYEVRGREVVLYWRALPAKAKVLVPISLIAAIPGTYTGPASRAYLYYTDEHKHWVDGLKVDIVPKS
ncbi:MAG TPA: alpha-2-macroglobulin family protein [Planktothrix sp.]|jgi:uncharacterized protein YfaS (alpha-2-macroglobulin family)